MSIPTQPTETIIKQKAYRLYGKDNPSSTNLSDADDGLAMVKNDLMNEGREWAFLRRTSYLPTTINVPHVQAPTDYSKLIKASVLDGTRRGTAQTGTSTTITLAAADSGTVGATEGKQVVLTGGTGSGQARYVKDFDSSTKVVTVDEDWSTTPDSTSTYLIVDEQQDLGGRQVWTYSEIQLPSQLDTPTRVYHFADDAEGDFYFDRVPDKIYVVRVEYYADLRKEDIDTSANARYNRILRLLEQLFVQGVFVWLLQNDSRVVLETQKYSSMLSRCAGEFLYPNMASQSVQLDPEAY